MRDRVLAGALVVPFLMGAAAAPSHPGHVELTFRDPDIIESSGLVVRDGLVVTTNDSGDEGRVFTVDPATGTLSTETESRERWLSPMSATQTVPARPGASASTSSTSSGVYVVRSVVAPVRGSTE